MKIDIATIEDLPEILNLQLLAFQPVAETLDWYDAPNLHETLAQARKVFLNYTTLKLMTDEGYLIGSVRGKVENGSLYIGRLMVLPEFQGKGFGSRLIQQIEACLPHNRAWLNTCEQLRGNVRLYKRLGFIPFGHERINDHLTRVFMEKNTGTVEPPLAEQLVN